MPYHFWLRSEVKENEKRTPVVPQHIHILLQKGHTVSVERSPLRCVADKQYEDVGCQMVEEGSWVNAPKDAIILGLKELPETPAILKNTHIYFGHCYKNQAGWQTLLKRFVDGNGTLLDLEFLVDDTGRRVAAFGISAGFIGMAVGLKNWCAQQLRGEVLGKLDYYADSAALVADIKGELEQVYQKTHRKPSTMIMGALGRSGRGCVDFAQRVGLENIIKWDLEETRAGGPFPQILDVDVFVNCIYLSSPIPPFVTREMLSNPNRKLTVVVDVSCDTSNPHNPLPIYTENTTFVKPTIRINSGPNPVDVISIDHLPSLVPLESSLEFSGLIVNHIADCNNSLVWTRAENLFKEKVQKALESLGSTSH